MPYLDIDPADLQRSHGLADADLPDAAIVWGVWSARGGYDFVASLYPNTREVAERTACVEHNGRRVWVSFVFGAAMAATHAHMAAVLGARAIIQIGSFGGLAPEGKVGDVLLPSQMIGRDGVSRQLSGCRPITPDATLRTLLREELRALGVEPRDGTLVSTTTIALERQVDIRRWQRAGYSGVEMEAAATLSVAQHFGVGGAGAFVLLDNLVAGQTVFTLTDTDRQRTKASRSVIARAAVAAAARAAL